MVVGDGGIGKRRAGSLRRFAATVQTTVVLRLPTPHRRHHRGTL
jgi:hypothetical protein